ncbi:TniQ family protein [Frateuria terrea]|uniref:TniQ protein n=1 Tax=Frateuria terrea TaxID=529704 RepID=A0A1H6U9N1_9GAMM|nr:TniQ protein [Frateuria terrea]SFP37347.1 TniQ protein [Frateuria terrea]
MNRGHHTPEGADTRWWIAGPGQDESLRSIVERAERLYGGPGDAFRRRLKPRATVPERETDLDSLSSRELWVLAHTVGVAPSDLFAHRLADSPWLLHALQRRAYCPVCWKEDHRAGRPPGFRRTWAGVFVLRCPDHDVSLHWHAPHQSIDLALNVPLRPRGRRAARLVRLIDEFARRFERALRGSEPWPPRWHGNPSTARALLMRCAANLGRVPELPPFSSVRGPPVLGGFVSVPTRRVEPLGDSPWECVRAMGLPAWRRAALWMVASYVVPALKDTDRPEGLPARPFAAIDAQWAGMEPHARGLRRTRRYREALQAACRRFEEMEGGPP